MECRGRRQYGTQPHMKAISWSATKIRERDFESRGNLKTKRDWKYLYCERFYGRVPNVRPLNGLFPHQCCIVCFWISKTWVEIQMRTCKRLIPQVIGILWPNLMSLCVFSREIGFNRVSIWFISWPKLHIRMKHEKGSMAEKAWNS